jgi:hypothetical protein
LSFSFYRNRPIHCDFSGGQITSDAGLLPLRAFEELWCAKIPSNSHLTDMLALVLLCFAWTRKPKKPARLAENTSQPDRPRAILTAHVSILSEC